ncbi:TVP38/TMEM64 family protein [Streptomyces ardesiacus]|uniref:TVP38/TMEM64 family protein n=1 Tax=Streptomyces ardesiacus TaxID=285564 RepID=UPI0007C67592|nr:TVP38/TMEM64 family protein [Streptomyces sp. NBRC 110030]
MPKPTDHPQPHASASRPDAEPADARVAQRSPFGSGLRAVSLLVLLAALSASMLLGGSRLLDEARDWVDSWGVWAPLVYAVLYALAETAFAPGAVLTASAGALFGVATGTITVLAGATAGAVLSFGLARWLGRPAVARWAGDGRLARLDAMVSARGFLAVLILRLIPVFPFALVNYAAGVTSIRLAPYVTATAIGIIPATVAYAGLGGTLDDPSSPGFWAALGALGLLAAGGSWAARRLRAREPRRDETEAGGSRGVRAG